MAKKTIKKIDDELIDTETGEVLENPDKKEKPVLNKAFAALKDYKAKINFVETKYKPQEWIDMSPAYKQTFNLPGMPVGHMSMIYGKSDTGKSTMATELAAYAQKQGIVPVFIITENKFSEARATQMGVNLENSILFKGVKTIEEGCLLIKNILDDLDNPKLKDFKFDVCFIWDSLGATPTKDELERKEDEGEGGAMMKAARVMKEEFQRYLVHRINGTRAESCPYNATLFIVNQGYMSPPNIQMGKRNTTIEPYGGDSLYLPSTLVFRIGGVMTRSAKVDATRNGEKMNYAIKSGILLEKNHITETSAKGTIICTNHGFILDDKTAMDEYKKQYAPDWNLEYEKGWDSVSTD
jgi:RecA/RadA recombinase